ncbi:hypothetical protein AB0H76_09610 [Nocardia sp. NPDC050712]|uniref:hypothetical protein n=1 Tax=Nocardia sp. NPDC050712 TaxID=3155518 RepID=UPI0033EC4936
MTVRYFHHATVLLLAAPLALAAAPAPAQAESGCGATLRSWTGPADTASYEGTMEYQGTNRSENQKENEAKFKIDFVKGIATWKVDVEGDDSGPTFEYGPASLEGPDVLYLLRPPEDEHGLPELEKQIYVTADKCDGQNNVQTAAFRMGLYKRVTTGGMERVS